MSLKGKTLVKGHSLLFEGKTPGAIRWTGGEGPGKCSCGVLSPSLPTTGARQRWHKEHKAEVLAAAGVQEKML